MKSHYPILWCFFALLAAAGCASTKVTSRERLVIGDLPRPDRIWVYDFVATPADVPAGSTFAGQYSEHSAPQTAEEIAAGRKLGNEIALDLVSRISAQGLPAALGSISTRPQINDILITGYLLSIDKGSAVERFAIGFGAGKSELRTAVEAFQITTQGLRKLGSGTLDSGGSKGPGTAVPLGVAIATGNPVGLIVSSGVKIVGEASGMNTIEGRAEQTAKEIADRLNERFQEQGWVYPVRR
jgi:hypothetical protein